MASSLDTFIDTLEKTEDSPYSFEIELPDVKKPIKAYFWRSSPSASLTDAHLCIYTHGAGGTCMSTASVNFCQGMVDAEAIGGQNPLLVLGFDGPMHLGSRTKTFVALIRCAAESDKIKTISLAGRSMGCRSAAIAAKECLDVVKLSHRLVLQSYPLIGAGKGTKDEERKQVLLDLPDSCCILFQIGNNDEMCPTKGMQEVRAFMEAHTSTIMVEQADHGLQLVAGAAPRGSKVQIEQDLGQTAGRIAGEWLLLPNATEVGDGTIGVATQGEESTINWTGFGKPVAPSNAATKLSDPSASKSKSKRKASEASHASPNTSTAEPAKRVRRSNR